MASRSASAETVTSSEPPGRRPSTARPRATRAAGNDGAAAGPTSTVTAPVWCSRVVGGGVGHQPAGVEHDHVVAHPGHVVEEVGGEHDGDAEGAQAVDEGEHLLPARRVEAGGGLVEEDELGVGDDGLGQLGPLAHAGGEPAHRPEAGLVQADQVEHLRRPLAGGPHRQPAELAEGGDHVGRGLVEGEAVVLGHVADAACARRWGRRPRGCRRPPPCPASGRRSPSRRRKRVVLPAPLAPTRPDPPGGQVEVDVVEGGDAAGYRLVSPRATTMLAIRPPTLPADRAGPDGVPGAVRSWGCCIPNGCRGLAAWRGRPGRWCGRSGRRSPRTDCSERSSSWWTTWRSSWSTTWSCCSSTTWSCCWWTRWYWCWRGCTPPGRSGPASRR